MSNTRQAGHAFALAMALAIAAPAFADESEQAEKVAGSQSDTDSRIEKLEQQIQVLAGEIASLQADTGVPEDSDLEAFYGMGPGASKVYQRDRGLSIGGYGEMRFRALVEDKGQKHNVFDALRAVIYAGYKFNDHIVFNSEIEFEHAGTSGGGSASVEFMQLDFLWKEWLNARTGLLLIPMGLVNEIHEPTFFYANERPEVERRLIPSTWRENGAGIFGEIGDQFAYRMYAVNGFDATGFSDQGLRGGRQKGSRALADDFAFVGRFDYEPLPGLAFGASVWLGNSGQDQQDIGIPDTFTALYEVHGQYRGYGLTVRGLWAQSFLQDTLQLSQALGYAPNSSVAKNMIGGYLTLAYDVLPLVFPETTMSLEPFFRFEHLDTQFKVSQGLTPNDNLDRNYYVMGLDYKPIPQVVLKFDYRRVDAKVGDVADEIEVGFGYVF